MPFPLLGLLIGAAAGAAKSAAVDAPAANRQRKLQAETTFYSPWTGMKGQAPKEADPFGSMLKFGTTGAMLHQNVGAGADDAASSVGDRINPANAAGSAKSFGVGGGSPGSSQFHLMDPTTPRPSPYSLMRAPASEPMGIADAAYADDGQGDGTLMNFLSQRGRSRGPAAGMY